VAGPWMDSTRQHQLAGRARADTGSRAALRCIALLAPTARSGGRALGRRRTPPPERAPAPNRGPRSGQAVTSGPLREGGWWMGGGGAAEPRRRGWARRGRRGREVAQPQRRPTRGAAVPGSEGGVRAHKEHSPSLAQASATPRAGSAGIPPRGLAQAAHPPRAGSGERRS
jgi:hypothetical protein